MNKIKRKRIKRPKFLNIILALIAIVLIAGVGLFLYVSRDSGEKESVKVYLYADTTPQNLKERLLKQLPEKYVGPVILSYRLLGSQAEWTKLEGFYEVEPGLTAIKFANRLRHNRQTPVDISINYARTFGDVAKIVSDRMEFDSTAFVNVADTFLPENGFEKELFISSVIPDKHEFYWTAKPEKVLERLLENYNRFWTDQRKAKARDIGLTPQQVSTLASIVESETAKSDEKPVIARLYLNRLQRGMKFQADPTVIFGIGDFSIRRVTGQHLKNNSPYNTYKYAGLPPGPIRMPSKEGIDAVLNASQHDYIYMCAKEDFSGYHNFSSNYAEHMANAKKYQAALNKKGIK